MWSTVENLLRMLLIFKDHVSRFVRCAFLYILTDIRSQVHHQVYHRSKLTCHLMVVTWVAEGKRQSGTCIWHLLYNTFAGFKWNFSLIRFAEWQTHTAIFSNMIMEKVAFGERHAIPLPFSRMSWFFYNHDNSKCFIFDLHILCLFDNKASRKARFSSCTFLRYARCQLILFSFVAQKLVRGVIVLCNVKHEWSKIGEINSLVVYLFITIFW